MASAAALTLLVMYWQPSAVVIYSAGPMLRLLLRAILLGSFAGIVWGIASLKEFDAFGVRAFLEQSQGQPSRCPKLVVAGPYRFVRHPFYAFLTAALWVAPVLSLDRLLLSALFTAWIVVGAKLEEKDFAVVFGGDYRAYQRAVGMLIPRLRRRPATAKQAAGSGG
jgi:protein-S-isoprenylcysteine O-methyltransferase Ste14